MKFNVFVIVSMILLTILTFGAVNAADNVTVDDLAVMNDVEDLGMSSSIDVMDSGGEIRSNVSAEKSLPAEDIANETNLRVSNDGVIGQERMESNDDVEYSSNNDDSILGIQEESPLQASTYVITQYNIDSFFDRFTGNLKSIVSAGSTLDFQGRIVLTEMDIQRRVYNITINKRVNIISSTHDAYIDLNTTAGSLFGDSPGNRFTVNYLGSGSTIRDIYIHNTQVWITNAKNVVFDNVSVVVKNQRVGSGVGVVSVRDNSSYVTIKNGYFYTENNGGSSTLVMAWANHCTFDNNTVEGRGNIGNMIYSTTYNVNSGPYENYPYSNDYNVIKNNVVNNPEGGTGICRSITIYGSHNIVDNNTINKGSGIYTQWGTDENQCNNTYSNNKLYDSNYFDVFPNSIVYNNVGTASMSLSTNSIAYNNTLDGSLNLGAGSTAFNNTVKSLSVSGAGATAYNNTVGTPNGGTLTLEDNAVVYDNIVNGATTIDGENIILRDSTLNGDVTITKKSTEVTIKSNEIFGTVDVKGSGNEISNNNITSTGNYAIKLARTKDNFVSENTLYAQGGVGVNAIQALSDTNIIDVNFPDLIGAIYVSKTGSDTNNGTSRKRAVATLTHAIEIAETGKIIILDGTYTIAGFTVNKDLDISGEDDVTLSLSDSISIAANTALNLTNIKFAGCTGSWLFNSQDGSNLTIDKCEFKDNDVSRLFQLNSNLTVTNSKMVNNTISDQMLYCYGPVSFDNVELSGNNVGIVMIIAASGNCEFKNCLFSNNAGGGIISCSDDNLSVLNCAMIGNSVGNSYLIRVSNAQNCIVKESSLINNKGAGAIFSLTNSELDVYDSVILNGDRDIFAYGSSDTSSAVTANDNWWGNNTKPLTGKVDVDRWVIMSVTPEMAWAGDRVTVTAKFDKTNSTSGTVRVYGGNLHDGFDVKFTSTTGGLNEFKAVKNHQASVTYTPQRADLKLTVTSTNAIADIPVEIPKIPVVYVSTTGLDTNDGASRQTAVASLAKAYDFVAENGEIIFLNGNYDVVSALSISKNVDISGENNVTLNFAGALTVDSADVNLTNIKFTSKSKIAQLLIAKNNSDVIIENCEFKNNRATRLLVVLDSNLVIIDSNFTGNDIDGQMIYNDGQISLGNVKTCSNDIGISVIYGNVGELKNTLFFNNTCPGIFNLNANDISILNCSIIENSLHNSPIISLSNAQNFTIKDSVIINNKDVNSVFSLDGSELNVSDSVILNNGDDIFRFDSSSAQSSVTADDNWWGNNTKPVTGAVDVGRWVIMSVTPEIAVAGDEVIISAKFDKTNSTSGAIGDYMGNLPDVFNVTFTSTSGGLNEVRAVKNHQASVTYDVVVGDKNLKVTSANAVVEIPVKVPIVYVSSTGLDTNDGASRQTAVASLLHAYDMVAENGKIIILNGTYRIGDMLLIEKNLDIAGEDNVTVISESTSTGFRINAVNVNITNIKFYAANQLMYMILAQNNANLTFDECEFRNTDTNFELLFASDANVNITNSKFVNNTVGGRMIYNQGYVVLDNVESYGNKVDMQMITNDRNGLELKNTIIRNNTCSVIIDSSKNNVLALNCTIIDNPTGNNNLIQLSDAQNCTIKESTLINSKGTGAIFSLTNSELDVSDSVILNNDNDIFKFGSTDTSSAVTANDNWWGNNTKPVLGTVDADRWVIMSTTPDMAWAGDEVTVVARFDKTSSTSGAVGDYGGNLPDGFNVTFTSTSGRLNEVKTVRNHQASVVYAVVRDDENLTVTSSNAKVDIPVEIPKLPIVYVSNEGNDANDGSSRATAIKTLNHAFEISAGKIIVLNGDYVINGPVTLANDLSIVGMGDVVIDCNNSKFLTTSFDLNLTNLRIINGYGESGSLINCNAKLLVDNCTFSDNVLQKLWSSIILSRGGGIINNTKFISNEVGTGVISCVNKALTIDNCEFEDNHMSSVNAVSYGTIYVPSGSINLYNSRLINNAIGYSVIYAGGSGNNRIVNSTFENNDKTESNNGVDIYVYGSRVTVSQSAFFTDNDRFNFIYVKTGSLNISDSVILQDNGYAIVKENSATVTANDNWWGSNNNPNTEISVDRWVIMTATPDSVVAGHEVTVVAKFDKTNSTSGDVENYEGNLPGGFNVTFSSESGGFNEVKTVKNHQANVTYTPQKTDGKLTVTSMDAVVEIPVEIPKPEVVYVSENGSDNNDGCSPETAVKNINYAITLIDSGKMIILPGTYVLDNHLTIRDGLNVAIEGQGDVIIDGNNHKIIQNKGKLNLTNLKFTNGNDDYSVVSNYGSNTYISMDNVEFYNNHLGEHACLISGDIGNVYINNSKFHDNVVVATQGLISINASDSIIENSIFANNTGGSTGVICIGGNSQTGHFVDIVNCTFENNKATSIAGAIWIKSDSKVNITGCKFINNTAEYGGAIYMSKTLESPTVNIKKSIFLNNTADNGCINVGDGLLNISESVIISKNGVTPIMATDGSATANDNWWGRNTKPATSANVVVNRWVIMSVTPQTAVAGDEVTVVAKFDKTNSSRGVIADYSGDLPDGFNVTFTSTSGNLNEVKEVNNHQANVTYTVDKTDEKLTVTSANAVVEIPVEKTISNIFISVEKKDIWFGDANVVTVIIPEATGTISVKLNGIEFATPTLNGGIATQRISAYNIVVGENVVEVSYGELSNSTTFNAHGNVVTPENFDMFFDDGGELKGDVPSFDKLIFRGEFNAPVNHLSIDQPLEIIGEGAVFINMGVKIHSDDVKLDNLTFIADTASEDGSLIFVDGNSVDLTNLNVSYSVGDVEAVAIDIKDCRNVNLLNSIIFFESHVVNDSKVSVGIQAVRTGNVLMDGNNITTKLPCVYVDNYDKDYYLMGSNNVNPVRLKDCNRLKFTNNNVNSTTNNYSAAYPTIQSIFIIGCSNSLIDHNNISMIDEMTPAGMDNYLYGIDFGYNVNVTFSYNNFNMSTRGGLDQHGTAYAFQGVKSEVIIKGNNITSRSNGPNLGLH